MASTTYLHAHRDRLGPLPLPAELRADISHTPGKVVRRAGLPRAVRPVRPVSTRPTAAAPRPRAPALLVGHGVTSLVMVSHPLSRCRVLRHDVPR